jgi:hypothetical protein
MRRQAWVGAVLLALFAAGGAGGGESPCREPPPGCLLGQLGPAGGWFPYGGGLLHWWPPHCFPRCGAPDDYCRKSLPPVCWPPYPPYYIWGPPEICCPQGKCGPACRDSH